MSLTKASFSMINGAPVNALDYGVVGDGTTDDTTAMQAALTAATGKTLLIPPSTYKITAQLNVPANTFISAYNATLNGSSGVFKLLKFANGGGIFGGTLVGVGGSTLQTGSIGISCEGTNNAPSAPTYVQGPIIRDVVIYSFAEYGIFLAYTQDAKIEDNRITGIGYAGIGGVSCNRAHVNNNYISDITPGTTDAYGIFIDRQNGTSETAEPRSYWCSITNNKIFNVVSVSGDNAQGIDTHAGVGFSIIGNEVVNCEAGIFVTASAISGTNQLGPQSCRVIGNTVRSTYRVGYGIVVTGAINGSTVVEYASNNVVEGNTVSGYGIAADGTSGAIRVTAAKGTIISGNTIYNSACNGVVLNLETRGAIVEGNFIVDPYDSTYNVPACVAVLGNNVYATISNNTFTYENNALGAYVATQSIRVGPGLTGLDLNIQRNSFVGLDATHLTYVEGTSTGVNSEGLMAQNGSSTLSTGVSTITFNKRFPSVPKVYATNTSDLNPVRVSAVNETGCTIAGTGTTAFSWLAST
jgi:hypothetical protein